MAHGEWGLLYRDEKEFRSHLLDLVNDADLRYEMGVKGIAFARTQSEQARVLERVAVYDEMLGAKHRRALSAGAGEGPRAEFDNDPGRI